MKKILLLTLCALSASLAVAQPLLSPQRGNASYYHDRFHGRRMANGERYDKDSMTCAHLKYPLGTWLHVRNPANGREVIVQVTDRGPYTRKFVIDLSRAAAQQLDIIRYGFRMVEITPYVQGKIPYKYDPPTERPELELGYTTDLAIGAPYWQDDSIYQSKHRLSRTEIVRLDPDTLRAVEIQEATATPSSADANGKSQPRR